MKFAVVITILFVLAFAAPMISCNKVEPAKTEQASQEKPKTNLNYLGTVANVYKTESVKVPAINDNHQAELMKAAE